MLRLTSRHVFAVGLIALLGLAPRVRADDIDVKLLQAGPGLVKELQRRNYQNVGVLKFEVQHGGEKGPVSMEVGRLNGRMANRLENVLILNNDVAKPLGITRDAGDVAAADNPKATQLKADGRRHLLGGEYPLAWGQAKVKVDAFLTGRVVLQPDLHSAAILIQAFDAKTVDAPVTLARVDNVPMTRALLSEMNFAFQIRKRGIELTKPDAEDKANSDAIDEARSSGPALVGNEEKKKTETGPAYKVGPRLDDVLEFKIFYDGKEIRPTDANKLPAPRKGQGMYFEVRSKINPGDKEKVALVLRVNGVNTADGDRTQKSADLACRWVLEPGQLYRIEGVYRDGKRKDFEAMELQRVRDENPDLVVETKLGKIELDLFRQGTLANGDSKVAERETNLAEPLVTTAMSPADAKKKALKAMDQVKSMNFAWVPGREREQKLETEPFEGYHVGHVAYTYLELDRAPKIGPPPVSR